MSLASEYQRQFGWRDWPGIFAVLPELSGRTILDLGCGAGDQAAELVARGAHVIGVDANDELLRVAGSRGLANVEFRPANLRQLPDLGVMADGLWSSFAAAYFPDLVAMLTTWKRHLRPGGWIALTEIDDLFGHEPLSPRSRALLDAYAREAFAAGRYDFHMGCKLHEHLARAGFSVSRVLTVEDQELAFQSPARAEVIDAWRARLERMTLLRELCGAEFGQLREEFLSCLAHAEHSSRAKVYVCLAISRD